MVRYFAMILFTLPTLYFSLAGQDFWPFYSYPLYADSAQYNDIFEIWAEGPDGSSFQVRHPSILWPVGPNGLDHRLKTLSRQGASMKDFEQILAYFAKRYDRLSKNHLRNLPEAKYFHLKQMKPGRNHKDPEHFIPRVILSYEQKSNHSL